MNIDVENVQHEDDFIVMMEVRVNEMITQALCNCMHIVHVLFILYRRLDNLLLKPT